MRKKMMTVGNLFRVFWVAAACSMTVGPAVGQAPVAPGPEPATDEQSEAEQPPGFIGFDLGAYYLKEFRAAQGPKSRLSFTLHASVPEEHADEFERLLKRREFRVRDQVVTASRISEHTEYEDPELVRFRRRIMVRLRRSLPELKIDDLYFSEFRFIAD